MAGGVGNLTVGLGLDAAAFTSGLTKAQAQAQAFADQTKATFLGALGAGLTRDLIRGLAQIPGAFTDVIRSAIDAADHLNDLSKKTGIAADTLGGIGFAAKQAGLDLDSVALGTGKLNRSLADAAAGNKPAIEAFKALGISVLDATGQTKKADVALAELATKFASYADGPEKVALAVRLFGKAGADMIPLLNDGGAALQGNIAYFQRYSGVTVEAAKAADQFNDTLTKINLLKQAFGNTVAADLLGPMQAVAQRFLEAKEAGNGFAGSASFITGAFVGVATAISFVIESLSVMATRLDGFIQKVQALDQAAVETRKHQSLFEKITDPFGTSGIVGKTSGARGAIETQVADDIAAAQKRYDRFVAALNFQTNPADYGNEGRSRTKPKPPAPRLPSATAGTDDPTKKLLDAQLKAIENGIAQERDLLSTRNKYLDFYNQEGLLSIRDFYAGRQGAQTAAIAAETAGYDEEIRLLRAYQARKGTSQQDRAGAEVKITELVGKRQLAEQKAAEASYFLLLQQQKSYEELAKAVLGVSVQVLDLKENFALAAAVKFDLQNDALLKTFSREGNAAGLEALAVLRAAAIAQGAFQKASLDAGRTLDTLANNEARIALAQQTGTIGTIEGLVKVGEARRAQIPLLEAQVAAEEAIARASGSEDLIRKAEAARLALDKLKASADPLAESLNKTFGGDFNSALDDFVSGTKNAAQAFSSFAKSVLNDILKMGTKSITESIFGGSGGAGGLISSLFSNGSAQGGSSGLVSGIGDLFSLFAGGFAQGGTIGPGQWGVVGEKGPELAFGGRTGKTITPATVGGTSQTINVNVQATPGMSRDTAMQQGAAIGAGIQRATARNS